MDEIQPMAPGGAWMSEAGSGEPQYIINPDHIKRLTLDGWQVVADPRLPVEEETTPEKGSEE